MSDLLGPVVGDRDPVRFTLLVSATIQGIASQVSSGRVPAAMGDALIGDAVVLFGAS